MTVSRVGTTASSIAAPASSARPQAPAATTHARAPISSPSVVTRTEPGIGLDLDDAAMVEHDRSGVDRRREKRGVRPVGQRDAAVRMEEDGLVRFRRDRPATDDLRAGEELVGDPARGKGAGILVGPGPEVEAARLHDQLLAGFRLDLPPALQRALRQTNVVRIGVREAEDPGGAVARAAIVPEAELLDEDDASPALRERTRRRDTGDPAPTTTMSASRPIAPILEARSGTWAEARQPPSVFAAFVAARASAL